MSCKIFTSPPPSLCVRLQTVVLIARPPLIVQATSRERLIPFISHLGAACMYFRERNTQRLSRRVGTKDNRRMSRNVRNTALRNHARHGIFFHANLTPSARARARASARGYVKSACDRFAEYRVKYEIVYDREKNVLRANRLCY